MNGTKALHTLQDVTSARLEEVGVISAYIVRSVNGEYHVVVVNPMEKLQGEVGFYTVDDSTGTYKLLNFIGLCKDRGPEVDYSSYLEERGLKVMAHYHQRTSAYAV